LRHQYILTIALAASILGGCKGNQDKTAPTEMRGAVQGIWVNKKYADTLLLTHSPKAAQNVSIETCLSFPDSIGEAVHVALGWHEGTDYKVIQGPQMDSLYDPNGKQNLGAIETISPEEIRIGPQYFIRLKHPNPKRYDYNVIEDLLFAGGYLAKDGSAVRFAENGRVSGLADTIRFYEPYGDYEGPGLDVDGIGLGSDSERLTTYGFKFDKDTLLLYKLDCALGYDSTDHSCGVVDFGEVKWKLIKKHS
jgi:hypothetical protein